MYKTQSFNRSPLTSTQITLQDLKRQTDLKTNKMKFTILTRRSKISIEDQGLK